MTFEPPVSPTPPLPSTPQPPPASTTPPGWHTDPWQQGGLRWWDGQAWTGYTAAGAAAAGAAGAAGADPAPAVAATKATGVWVRRLLVLAPVAQILAFAALGQTMRSTFERIDAVRVGAAPSPFASFGPGMALAQLLSLVGVALGVFRMVWLFRATRAARSLGVPTRRDAGLACAGWIIPIVNFWWPLQSMRDLVPGRALRHAGWWWACALAGPLLAVGAFEAWLIGSLVARDYGRPMPVAIFAVAAVLTAVGAVLEARLVRSVEAVHAELLGSRLGQQPGS